MRVLAITGPRARAEHLQAFKIPGVEVRVLRLPEPATAESEADASSPDLVLLLGGDGTLNRHLSWLVHKQIPVLPAPVGSGNDFAASHGIPDLQKTCEVFGRMVARGKVTSVSSDLGRARFVDGKQSYFSCCLNVGLDADAARRANLLPDWIKERHGYFLGGLGAALFFRPKVLKLSQVTGRDDVEMPAWFVTISNTPVFGGGLKIAPQARMDDGKLNITLAPRTGLTRLSLLRHYPKIISGRHIGMKELHIFTATQMRIESPFPGPVYGDGEHLGDLPVEVNVVPKAIEVISGKQPL